MLHCHVTGIRAAAFSTNHVSAVFSVAHGGESELKFLSALGFRKGGRCVADDRLGLGPLRVGIWRYYYQYSSYNPYSSLDVFDLAASAVSGRHCVLCHVAECLKVLWVNGLRGLEIHAPQSISTSPGYIPR